MEKENNDLIYPSAPIWRRGLAALIDFVLVMTTAIGMYVLLWKIMPSSLIAEEKRGQEVYIVISDLFSDVFRTSMEPISKEAIRLRLALALELLRLSGALLLPTLIFHLFVPLCIFKRGRQTLGRHLFKLSLINVEALNLSPLIYLARYLLLFFIYCLISLFTLCLPIIYSTYLIFRTERHSNLIEGRLFQYMVYSPSNEVYLDYEEYVEDKRKRKEALLKSENKI